MIQFNAHLSLFSVWVSYLDMRVECWNHPLSLYQDLFHFLCSLVFLFTTKVGTLIFGACTVKIFVFILWMVPLINPQWPSVSVSVVLSRVAVPEGSQSLSVLQVCLSAPPWLDVCWGESWCHSDLSIFVNSPHSSSCRFFALYVDLLVIYVT